MSFSTFNFDNWFFEIVFESAASCSNMRGHSIVNLLTVVAETCGVQLVVGLLTAKTIVLLRFYLFFDVTLLICCSTIIKNLNLCNWLQLGENVNVFVILISLKCHMGIISSWVHLGRCYICELEGRRVHFLRWFISRIIEGVRIWFWENQIRGWGGGVQTLL